MAGDINRVTIVGRLTRDPELRHLPSGTSVLQLGVAVNGRQKDDAGNWIDKPNFFDVKVFGNQADTLNTHLSKGRRIGVDGRLDWSSWEAQDGSKRSKVEPRPSPFRWAKRRLFSKICTKRAAPWPRPSCSRLG